MMLIILLLDLFSKIIDKDDEKSVYSTSILVCVVRGLVEEGV
jgi:hypothetical protein